MTINMRVVVYLILVIAYVQNTVSSDDWESLQLDNVEEFESNSVGTNRSPVVPIEEPDVSEDEAEKILENIGFHNKDYNTDEAFTRLNNNVESRILQYQKYYELPRTGELDRETKISLNRPKCGLSELTTQGHQFKWSKRYLTYHVANSPPGVAPSGVKKLLRKAFHQWSNATLLDFSESSSPKADIKVMFEDHRFEAKNQLHDATTQDAISVLASYPEKGVIRFNSKFYWENSNTFLHTAMHEIGHALGMSHSSSRASIMYPFLDSHFSELPQVDIEAVQLKYGRRHQSRSVPEFCSLSKYDAVVSTARGLLFIAGKFCYQIFSNYTIGQPTLLSERWPGIPDSVDAAVTIDLETFVFKTDQVWSFKYDSLQQGYPRKIRNTFPGLPNNLDAVAYDRKYVYAFKNDHYWRYNPEKKAVDRTEEVSAFDIPSWIDAALYEKSRDRLYFYKDTDWYFYSFNTTETEKHDSAKYNCKEFE